MTNPMGLDEMRRILKRDRTEPFDGNLELRTKVNQLILETFLDASGTMSESELDRQATAHLLAHSFVKTGITYTELGLSGYMGALPDVLILEHSEIERMISRMARRIARKEKKWDRD